MQQSTQQATQQPGQNLTVIDPDDPLLIAQSLTYVTDNGSVVATFQSSPFSFGKEDKLHQTTLYSSIKFTFQSFYSA